MPPKIKKAPCVGATVATGFGKEKKDMRSTCVKNCLVSEDQTVKTIMYIKMCN